MITPYTLIWIIGILSLGLIISLLILYRYQRRMRSELERLIEERTKSLVVEKERVESARAEAERQKEIAMNADRLKTEFLNIVAHDLKSPLISIKMLSKIIMEETGRSSEVKDYAADIFSNAQRMHNLVNEILESSVIESGTLVLNKQRIDLGRLAELVVLDNRIAAQQKEQKIIFNSDVDCIIVEGDEECLRSALDNLINNAIKYSPLRKGIWVNCSKKDKVIRFEVRDEGSGLTDEDKNKVFGKFQKLSVQPTGGEPSTGIGLSIVKQLIEMHGGKVWVESEFGNGSCFIIELPLIESQ